MEEENFTSFFQEKLRDRGLSLQHLSELTNISLNYLERLSVGDYKRLPPAPYVRGYLIKLGAVLSFEPEFWWEKLKHEGVLPDSGPEDALPKNRFARTAPPKLLAILLVVVVFLIYLAFRFSAIFGKPQIAISYPGGALTRTTHAELLVTGTLKGGDELLVNGEEVTVSRDGSWSTQLLLQPGLNSIEIRSKKFLGGETTLIRQILYEPLATSTPTSTVP